MQSLVSDLQTGSAPVQSPSKLWANPTSRSEPSPQASCGPSRAQAAAGACAPRWRACWSCSASRSAGVSTETPSSPLSFTTDPGAKSDGITPVVLTPPKQLHSLGGLTGLVEQMKQKFGDTNGYRLIVYPDYASLDRPDPNDDRRQLSYTYRGGSGYIQLGADGSVKQINYPSGGC